MLQKLVWYKNEMNCDFSISPSSDTPSLVQICFMEQSLQTRHLPRSLFYVISWGELDFALVIVTLEFSNRSIFPVCGVG